MAKLFNRAEEESKWRSLEEDMRDLMAKVDEAIKSAKLIEWQEFSDAVAKIKFGINTMERAIGEK